MGKAISLTLEGKKQPNVVLLNGGISVMAAMKWLIEKPAQHVQWQNGEQSSCCGSSFCWLGFVSAVFDLLSFADTPLSAQGIALSAKKRKAIIKAINFIGCKYKPYSVLMANQKLQPYCKTEVYIK